MKVSLQKDINMELEGNTIQMDLITIVDGNLIKKLGIFYFIMLKFINIDSINIKVKFNMKKI